MKEEIVDIVDTYNQEGYLIKRVANNVPIFVPKQHVPSIQIIDPDTEWVTEKIWMTREEFANRFGKLPTPPMQGDNEKQA